MAFGDVTAEILASGYQLKLTVEGFSFGMTADVGEGAQAVTGGGTTVTNGLSDPANANIVLNVVSEGFDSGGNPTTVARTIYGVSMMRAAFPNEAQQNEPGAGEMLFSLSDFVYDDDRDGGAGTSGTDPTITIAAGTLVNAGGGGEPSNAASGATVVNSSTLDYPEVIGRWNTVPYQRLTSDFTLEFEAYHGHDVAACRITADGASHQQAATLTQTTARQRPVSGLYGSAYTLNAVLEGFDQGEKITCAAEVWPVVGDDDSVLRTADNAAEGPELMRRNFEHTCDKTGALVVYGVVSTTGDDGTGVVSADLPTAEASPYLNVKSAITAGANVVYCRTGSHKPVGVNTAQRVTGYWIVVEPHPSDDPAGVIIEIDSSQQEIKCDLICYRNVGYTRAAAGNCWPSGNNTDSVWYDGIRWIDDGRGQLTTGILFKFVMSYFTNCKDLRNVDCYLRVFSSHRCGQFHDGSTIISENASGSSLEAVYGMTATKINGNHQHRDTWAAAPASDPSGLIHSFNHIDSDADNPCFNVCNDSRWFNPSVAFVGNLIERHAAATQQTVIECGNTSDAARRHVVMWHNTALGAKSNMLYDTVGTGDHAPVFWRHNVFSDFHCKSDVFASNGLFTGGWPVGYKAGWNHNHDVDYNATETGSTEWITDGLDLTTGNPGFVDDQSGPSGSGGGNYEPDVGSVLLDRVPAGSRLIEFDLYGTALPDDGTAEIGAVQSTAEPPLPPTTGDLYVDVSINTVLGNGGAGSGPSDWADLSAVANHDWQDGDTLYLQQSAGYVEGDISWTIDVPNLTIQAYGGGDVELTRSHDVEIGSRDAGTTPAWSPAGSAWTIGLVAPYSSIAFDHMVIRDTRGDGRVNTIIPKAADLGEALTTPNRWFLDSGTLTYHPDAGAAVQDPNTVINTGYFRLIEEARTEPVLSLGKPNGLTLDGVDLTLSPALLYLANIGENASNVTIRNCEFIDPWYMGDNTTRAILWTHGAGGNVSNVTIHDCVCQGSLIRVDDPGRTTTVSNFTIRDVTHRAAWPTYADNTTAYPDLVDPARSLSISIASIVQTVSNIVVTRNVWQGYTLEAVQSHSIRCIEIPHAGAAPPDPWNPSGYPVRIVDCQADNMPGTYLDGHAYMVDCAMDFRANDSFNRSAVDIGTGPAGVGVKALIENCQFVTAINPNGAFPVSVGDIPGNPTELWMVNCDVQGNGPGSPNAGLFHSNTGNGKIHLRGCALSRTGNGRLCDNFASTADLDVERCAYSDVIDDNNWSDTPNATTKALYQTNVDDHPDAVYDVVMAWSQPDPRYYMPTGTLATLHLDVLPADGRIPTSKRGINRLEYGGYYGAWQTPEGLFAGEGDGLPGRRRRRAAMRRAARGGR